MQEVSSVLGLTPVHLTEGEERQQFVGFDLNQSGGVGWAIFGS